MAYHLGLDFWCCNIVHSFPFNISGTLTRCWSLTTVWNVNVDSGPMCPNPVLLKSVYEHHHRKQTEERSHLTANRTHRITVDEKATSRAASAAQWDGHITLQGSFSIARVIKGGGGGGDGNTRKSYLVNRNKSQQHQATSEWQPHWPCVASDNNQRTVPHWSKAHRDGDFNLQARKWNRN